MIPTSIDGTDITGATIDGDDVQEITVDGQTVFSAGPSNLPVAFSNLVAWYPFDSATYGGSNADDVTAIIGGSGDDTAYDGTVSGPTYQSSGGVTDINAGASSGAFDFGGSADEIDTGRFQPSGAFTLMAWFRGDGRIMGNNPDPNGNHVSLNTKPGEVQGFVDDDSSFLIPTSSGVTASDYHHGALRYNGSTSATLFVDGSDVASDTGSVGTLNSTQTLLIGSKVGSTDDDFVGEIDDVRIYNTDLADTQIEQIVQNTQDPNNPVFP